MYGLDSVNTSRGFRDAIDLKGARWSRAWSSVALTMCELTGICLAVEPRVHIRVAKACCFQKSKKAEKEKQKEQIQEQKK